MAEIIITETELQAYVDDQLDAMGRLEVADYLVRHPDAVSYTHLTLPTKA